MRSLLAFYTLTKDYNLSLKYKMPRHKSSGKSSSSKALREPEFAASSTSVPFNPMASSYSGKAVHASGSMAEGMERHGSYGGGKSAHSRGASALSAVAPHPAARGGMIGADGAKAASHGQAPSATSLQGSLGIIEHPMNGNRNRHVGIPGIISSTSLGPQQRQRLVNGIIESGMADGASASGPVHAVMGHDATAYNEGMVHIRGSSFK